MKSFALTLLLVLPFAARAFAQTTVMPPGTDVAESFASDSDAWTWRTLRASCRYPASWLNAPRTISSIAWRADSTYAWTYDRLAGQMTLRAGPWMGDTAVAWNANLPVVFQGDFDPPQMVVTQAWTPQPFTFVVPLSAPVVLVQGGLEVDVSFVGPWDPVWGNRATYWVDSAMNPNDQSGLSDKWLDYVPPYMGCAGWVSETRLDRVQGQITMEARGTGLFSAPAIIAVGTQAQELGCADIVGTIFLPAVTDAGGWLQYSFPRPAYDFLWAWQMWIYDATRPADQCFGSGHGCVWNYGDPWPCQLVYAYSSTAPAPSGFLNGIAWVVRVQ